MIETIAGVFAGIGPAIRANELIVWDGKWIITIRRIAQQPARKRQYFLSGTCG
jgi:hypothetical protein